MMPLFALVLSALATDPSLRLVPVSEPAARAAEPVSAPPVKLWINNSGQFREGDRARVQVEARDDGYLMVFNVDTDGRLRVLFPVDPEDDAMVRGGHRYEIRGRGDRESFMVGRDGSGLVYAAVSADPFRIDDVVAAGNWDYTRLGIDHDARDAEADITDLLQKMSTDRGFDYDVLNYRVYGYRDRYVASSTMWYPRPYGYWDDYYCDSGFRVSLFGCRYYPAGGWYYGYSPYGYGYYGRGYYGGYYGGYYPGYYGRRHDYGSAGFRGGVITGRPRGYTIVRRDNNNDRGRPGNFGSFGSGAIGGGSRPMFERPRGYEGRRPTEGGVRPNVDGVAGTPSGDRPRGRRVDIPEDRGPMVERDRGRGDRGPVDFGGGNGRGPERQPEAERERPRNNDRPRDNPPPRRDPPPSASPRSGGAPSSAPRGGDRPRPHRP